MRNDEQENDADAVDSGSAGRADAQKSCSYCGEEIDVEEWHPVATRTDDDGTFRVYAFCSDDCKDAWTDD